MRSGLLVVCTANVCRSPSAAAVLRAGLGPEVDVVSAGSQAEIGGSACPVARRLIATWGATAAPGAGVDRQVAALDLAQHRPTQLTAEAIQQADLVLTMTRQHRSAVVALSPTAQRITFPIRYAAGLVPALLVAPNRPVGVRERVGWLAAELHDRRGDQPAVSDVDEAVPDPHLDRSVSHEAAFGLLDDALERLLALLRS